MATPSTSRGPRRTTVLPGGMLAIGCGIGATLGNIIIGPAGLLFGGLTGAVAGLLIGAVMQHPR